MHQKENNNVYKDMNIGYIDIPNGLENKIILRINKEKKKILIFKISYTSIILFASILAMMPIINNLLDNLKASGFYEYISLIYSDSGILLSYWKEFIMLVTSSLPFFTIAISLTILGILIWSLSNLNKNIKNIRTITI